MVMDPFISRVMEWPSVVRSALKQPSYPQVGRNQRTESLSWETRMSIEWDDTRGEKKNLQAGKHFIEQFRKIKQIQSWPRLRCCLQSLSILIQTIWKPYQILTTSMQGPWLSEQWFDVWTHGSYLLTRKRMIPWIIISKTGGVPRWVSGKIFRPTISEWKILKMEPILGRPNDGITDIFVRLTCKLRGLFTDIEFEAGLLCHSYCKCFRSIFPAL